jgi:serine/threonine protein kinase
VKIADFGLSRFLNDDEKYYFTNENSKFPFLWTPPESWANQKGKFNRFSTKSNVWSFGVTMWEMFSYGKQPWNGKEIHEVRLLKKVQTLNFSSYNY